MKFNEIQDLFNIDDSYYYVYEHWLDGEIIYVGKGMKDRAFSNNRSDSWHEKVGSRLNEVKVEIKGHFKSEQDAFDFEEMIVIGLIQKGVDLTNIMYNPDRKAATKTECERSLIREVTERLSFSSDRLKKRKASGKLLGGECFNNELKFNSNSGAVDIVDSFISDNPDRKAIILCERDMVASKWIASRLSSNDRLNVLEITYSKSRINKTCTGQLNSIQYLLDTGVIPKPYNVIIIPVSLLYILDLVDESIGLAVLNTVNESDRNAVSSEFRGTIGLLAGRAIKYENPYVNTTVPEEYLNEPLTSEDRTSLCIRLNIINDRGKVSSWPSVKGLLEKLGYRLKEKSLNDNGKRTRVIIISEPEEMIKTK